MTSLTDTDLKDLEDRAHPTPIIKAALFLMLILTLTMCATLLLIVAEPVIAVILLLQGAGDVSIFIPLWIATFILHLAVRWIGPAIQARWLDSYLRAGMALRKARARRAAASSDLEA